MFSCCTTPLTKGNTANAQLFPQPTCVNCALASGKVFRPAPRCDEIQILWRSEKPLPTLPTALDKHNELVGPWSWWCDSIGLYGDGGTATPRYELHQADVGTIPTWNTQWVYRLEDIQKNVDEIKARSGGSVALNNAHDNIRQLLDDHLDDKVQEFGTWSPPWRKH